jgi:hypothetical protein
VPSFDNRKGKFFGTSLCNLAILATSLAVFIGSPTKGCLHWPTMLLSTWNQIGVCTRAGSGPRCFTFWAPFDFHRIALTHHQTHIDPFFCVSTTNLTKVTKKSKFNGILLRIWPFLIIVWMAISAHLPGTLLFSVRACKRILGNNHAPFPL